VRVATTVKPAGRATGILRRALRPFAPRFAWASVYFVVVFALGTAGYMFIEHWPWFEAFYMAVTTTTSVGFMEVRPLTVPGRSFTMVLVVLGVTGLGIWWGLITALIVELDLLGLLRRRRVMNAIAHLHDHFILCGLGRMGRVVAEEMMRSEVPFVVIERDPARVDDLREEHPNLLAILEDATREASLEEAGIARARGLAACLHDDADNLLVCLTARGMRRDLTIVARADDEETIGKLRRAGASHSISPNVTGGVRMAATLIRPTVVSFLDVTGGRDLALRMEEAEIPAGSQLVGRTLAEAQIPQQTGLMVIALRRRGEVETINYNPGPDTRLDAGDIMLVLGRQEQVVGLRNYVAGPDAGN